MAALDGPFFFYGFSLNREKKKKERERMKWNKLSLNAAFYGG